MNDKLSLTELQLIIKDSLYASLPGFYWVFAEISEIKENYAGHCYLELVEKHPDEINVRAKIKGIIWSKRYRFLKPLFESMTGETLREGLKILIKIKVEYHEVYGLSIVIHDVDPTYTVGEMALKRQQIIRRLEDEGVISMNKELGIAIMPKRIAIISSRNAAGYTDFMNHLTSNEFGYTFYTAIFESVMQGKETEPGIINALDRISLNISLFDVVIIIRGGGAQSDLSWFDNYNIAYHITQFPLPVITGIGHEKDMSVTDIVAFRAEKTPTAVADFLINCMANAEDLLQQLSNDVTELSMEILEENRERLDNSRMRLIPLARIMVSSEKERLSDKIIDIINIGKEFLVREEFTPVNQKSRLKSAVRQYTEQKKINLEDALVQVRNSVNVVIKNIDTALMTYSNSLNLLSPLNVLKRGYSITSINGQIINTVKMVNINDIIDTRLNDGILRSSVKGKKTDRKR
jgi:exodeoxyribonuclease VII large subunit